MGQVEPGGRRESQEQGILRPLAILGPWDGPGPKIRENFLLGCWDILAPSLAVLELFGAILGWPGVILGLSWAILGHIEATFWGGGSPPLGGSWSHLKAILEQRSVDAACLAERDQFWDHFGDHFGAYFWVILGSFWGPFRVHFGVRF